MTLTIVIILGLIFLAACASAWSWYHVMFNYVLPELARLVKAASKAHGDKQ